MMLCSVAVFDLTHMTADEALTTNAAKGNRHEQNQDSPAKSAPRHRTTALPPGVKLPSVHRTSRWSWCAGGAAESPG
jgi:hypothetical protein